MMLGSSLAGMAFSNASVALVHGMSRPLGVHFHVPHGMSNAMLLPQITAFSLSSAPQRYADCAVFMGLTTNSNDITHCHQQLLQFLESLNSRLKVPKMSEFGIQEPTYMALLETMAEQALASGSPANNPKIATHEEIVELYKLVYAS